MHIELKVQQVSSISKGMVKLMLIRHGMKAKIQPIPHDEEQKVVQDMVSRVQQAMEDTFPGGVMIGGPTPLGKKWDAVIDMQITEDEYSQLGKPGIGDIIEIEINKAKEPQ
ncbi:MAG: hypothetical protein NWF08_02440 [Candidatus Bathyarchaeota archaeon]|nr:hypothetical protein [Candidatus Bathyarchaeota archaeon]